MSGDHKELLGEAVQTIRRLRARLAEAEGEGREPIAVVGIGCRFPGGVSSAGDYWEMLAAGRDGVAEIPADRWDVDFYHDPDPDSPGKICTRDGGFLEDKARFDPRFFRIAPREAIYIDPQQRMLLEVAWEALEHAGIPADEVYGSETGVFVGISSLDYSSLVTEYLPEEEIDPTVGTGSAHSPASGRISYFFGFHGPSLAVDTACSSSLISVHVACESLRRSECRMALAGGVNMMLSPFNHIVFSRANMLSPDGRCKAFDESANGYVRSEGVGLVVLKRLSDARADGDNILALIRGGAANQDGPSGGLTVPNGPAQQAVIRKALEDAGVEAAEIDYVEAHGTGTALGDPIEMNALGSIFSRSHDAERPLRVGSAKTNLGHMEAAAGIGGLIKVVLQLDRGTIAPHLHLESPSSRISWDRLPVQIPTAPTPWPRGERRRIAGVSSFGFSGTNAHLILEEAPATTPPAKAASDRPRYLLTLSAKSDGALDRLAAEYRDHLAREPETDFADLCYTANAGRSHLEQRLAVVVESAADLEEKLTALAEGRSPDGAVRDRVRGDQVPPSAFLFTGQGAQRHGMGRELYETEPVFRRHLAACDEILAAETGWSPVEVLYEDAGAGLVDQTGYTQPLLFSVEYALARLWHEWGVRPRWMLGHSVGEFVAATLAGVFSLADGLKLIAARGRLMQALPPGGGMLAIQESEESVRELVEAYPDEVSVAAINGPRQTVISGAGERLAELAKALEERGVRSTSLAVSHAFHSPLMEPMLDEFREVAAGVRFSEPELEMISNVTGGRVGAEIASADYWCRHVRAPVRFDDGIRALHGLGCRTFVEVGPQATLSAMGRRCLADAGDCGWFPSLRPGESDCDRMLRSLAGLYVRGQAVDWSGFDRELPRRRLRDLPTYPFERERYWFAPHVHQRKISRQRAVPVHPLLGRRAEAADGGRGIVFEAEIGEERPAYLRDHRVFGKAIFPGSGYVEIALAAGRATLGDDAAVRDLTVRAPLLLEGAEPVRLRTELEPDESGGYAFRIVRERPAVGGGGEVQDVHAQGTLALPSGGAAPPADGDRLERLQGELAEELEVAAYYEDMRGRGLEYGPSFQAIRELRRRDGQALGRLALSEPLAQEADSYRLHPALLDAAFQALGSALDGGADGTTYLPVGIGSVTASGNLGEQGWAHVSLDRGGKDQVRANVALFDAEGAAVARVSGLQLLRTTRKALKRALSEDPTPLLYHYAWIDKVLAEPGEEKAPAAAGRWLILADRGGLGERLANELRERGGDPVVVARVGPDSASLASFSEALAGDEAELAGVVYLGALDLADLAAGQEPDLEGSGQLGCGDLLAVLRALSERPSSATTRVFLVTRGAFLVDRPYTPLRQSEMRVEQGALAGLLRTARYECPGLTCLQLDLDPAPAALDVEALQICRELVDGDGEEQVAVRTGRRLAARFERLPRPAAGPPLQGPSSVVIDSYGALENLSIEPLERRAPGPGEVEVEVRAAGLNFKDVLLVLGMLKKHAEEQGLEWVDRRELGFECSGTVARTGPGVEGVRPGDRVIAYGMECLKSFVTLPAASVVGLPDSLSFEEAASISTVFLTSFHALHNLADIRAGDKVLIHAAAGGVGQAAIQLCRRVGAEIFATASPPKWDFLRAQGVSVVMNSRNLDFRERVLAETGGRGVDVVLNSLSGDFIPANLEVLAEGGRFVEIGKLGIWSPQQVAVARPDLSYFTFDLSEVEEDVTHGFQQVLTEVTGWMAAGEVRAIPLKTFPVAEVTAAFRHLAQAKNIGKVIVAFPPVEEDAAAAEEPAVRADGSYLVTGGLGALGLEVAEWLTEQGATELALVGRSAPSEQAQARLAELGERGVRVETFAADVSDRRAVAGVLQEIDESMAPLAGIVHAAGVLDDGVLQDQDAARFERVMRPKVSGAWNLHDLTRDRAPDLFVCFSSLSGLLGSPGQANYAAANSFLDALMEERRRDGRAGLSVGWGPWGAVGMAAELDSRQQQRMAARGVRPLPARRALNALERLLELRAAGAAPAQLGVADIEWEPFLRRSGLQTLPRLFASLEEEKAPVAGAAAGAGEGGDGLDRASLESAPADSRHGMLMDFVRGRLARVLGYSSPQQIEPRHRFFDLGIDSLSSVELKNEIESALGCSLPVTALFDYPTLESMIDYLHDEILDFGVQPEAAAAVSAAERVG